MLQDSPLGSPRHNQTSRRYNVLRPSDPGPLSCFGYHPSNDRRKMYVPSWIEKVERSRRALEQNSDEKGKVTESHVHVMDDGSGTDDYCISTASTSAYNSGFNPHELLERQYKVLHRSLLELPTGSEKKPHTTVPQIRRNDVRKLDLKFSERKKKYAPDHPVIVKDLLDSCDDLGSDHFYKHLQCVKELAKRYRRTKKKRRQYSSILEVDD